MIIIEFVKRCAISSLAGIALIWMYDIFSILIENINGKVKHIILSIKDFSFAVMFSVLIIMIMYYFNNGSFRGIYVLSVVIGIFVYYNLFCGFLRNIARVILFPVKYILKKLLKILAFLIHTIEKIYFKLYNKKESYKL